MLGREDGEHFVIRFPFAPACRSAAARKTSFTAAFCRWLSPIFSWTNGSFRNVGGHLTENDVLQGGHLLRAEQGLDASGDVSYRRLLRRDDVVVELLPPFLRLPHEVMEVCTPFAAYLGQPFLLGRADSQLFADGRLSSHS